MIRETYKGRTFKVVKGRKSLHVRITVNGECLGEWLGGQEDQADWVRRSIDAIDADDRAGRPYADYWYAKAA